MDANDFLSSAIVVVLINSLIGLALFSVRNYVKSWIDSRVRIVGDKEIEEFKSSLEIDRSRISAIQDVVLHGRSSRQAIVDSRRFDAIDQMWLAVRELDQFSGIPNLLTVLNLDRVFDVVERDQNIQKMFSILLKDKEIDNLAPNAVFQDHYIPKKIKNAYDGYMRIIGMSVAIATLGASGIDPRSAIKFKGIGDDIRKLFPEKNEMENMSNNYIWLSYSLFFRELLSLEIRWYIEGAESDYTALEKITEEKGIISSSFVEALKIVPKEMRL